LYAGQLTRGSAYVDLRRCAVILITNFAELPTVRFHSRFRVRGEGDTEPLTDHLELHLVELPKLKGALDRNEEPILAAWGKFLTAASDEDLEALAMQHPVLKQAKDALDHLSADPEARLRAEQREMALISYELDLGKAHNEGKAEGRAEGKAEGRAEGKAEGRAEGKAELLLELLTDKFGEPPATVRTRVAAAPPADLSRWAKRALSSTTLDDVFDLSTATNP
jgi:predicted transposase/invertase (TIGR01784 family)